MPFYDLKCGKCGAEFNKYANISDRSQNRILCPECGANEMLAVFKGAPGYIMKNDSAAACPNSESCGKACPHAS